VGVGSDPRGIVLNSVDTRAYVMNYISRDVTVLDISDGAAPIVVTTVGSTALPPTGTQESLVQAGKSLFNSAIGQTGTAGGSLPPGGRMSSEGRASCYSCHPDGLTDSVVWMFPDGPRRTRSLGPTPGIDDRILGYSAIFDELQDVENYIRTVSGGEGLIADANVAPLGAANAGRSAALDALAAYISSGIRSRVAPPASDANVSAGRALFAAAGCISCHGGSQWTSSIRNFTPPPSAGQVSNGQLVAFLRNVGTFDSNAPNEMRANQTSVVPALGALGLSPPSLVDAFATAPYLHNGSAPTLDAVLENVTHRSAGTGGVDTLTNPNDRARVVEFLRSIDAETPPF